MSQVQTWYYKYDADITFGEVHVSKAPKIILAGTLIGLVVLGTSALIFKDYIRDLVDNPQLEFDNSIVKYDEQSGIYSVDVDISNTQFFDPNKYIYTKIVNGEKDFSNLRYTYDIDTSNLDLTKVGDYTITYSSRNRIQSAQNNLVIHVNDITAPVVSLKLSDKEKYHVDLDPTGAYILTLIRGKETDNFDPSNYIDFVSDNYSDTENIQVEYTKNIDFSAKNTAIIYSATDEAGNLGITNLRLEIVEDEDAEKAAREEELKRLEEEYNKKLEDEKKQHEEEIKQIEEDKKNQETTTGKDNNNNSGGNSGQQQQTPDPGPANPPTPAYEETPSISATDVTVSISEGEDAIVSKIIGGINYRGSTGVAQPSNMPGYDFPIEVGTYIVTWNTTNGLSCTQTVTITE